MIDLETRHDADTLIRRHGTWQFMSAALLEKPGHPHALEDDIESFVHVLGWTVLSYLPSPMDKDDRAALVSYLYDHSWKTSSGEKGGLVKALYLKSGNYPPHDFMLPEPSQIPEPIREVASPFQARYSKAPTEAQVKRFQRFKALVSNGQLDEESLNDQLVHQYQLGIHRLSSSEWFLSTIQDAFERPGWPAEDRA
ncbi:hypothetical protein EDD15DRAFT_2556972, partial [Pisolithus albus]